MNRELPQVGATPQAFADWASRSGNAAVLGGLADQLVQPGQAVTEGKASDNSAMLLAGDHVGIALRKPRSLVRAAPGARVVRQATAAADCTFEGVHFVSTPESGTASAPLAIVRAGVTARFVNCTFERRSTDTALSWLSVEVGGVAHIIGCTFIGTPAAGECVANAGFAANVGVWASNKTGRAIGAATTAIFVTN